MITSKNFERSNRNYMNFEHNNFDWRIYKISDYTTTWRIHQIIKFNWLNHKIWKCLHESFQRECVNLNKLSSIKHEDTEEIEWSTRRSLVMTIEMLLISKKTWSNFPSIKLRNSPNSICTFCKNSLAHVANIHSFFPSQIFPHLANSYEPGRPHLNQLIFEWLSHIARLFRNWSISLYFQ